MQSKMFLVFALYFVAHGIVVTHPITFSPSNSTRNATIGINKVSLDTTQTLDVGGSVRADSITFCHCGDHGPGEFLD